jgi:transposase
MAYAASIRSPSFVHARVLQKAFITAGRRSSWKPASDGFRATRRVPRSTARSKDLRRQAQEVKEVVAEQALELRLLKKA